MYDSISYLTLHTANTPSMREGSARPVTGRVESGSLPCLFSNISIQQTLRSSQHRKSANALSWNVSAFCERFGIENLGFLTLTFADHVTDCKEAQKRLNSLFSNVIKPRYGDYVGVLERQRSGRIHYHLLVNLGFDVRTGFDFSQVENQNYSSANSALRAEWSFWRKTAKAYRFGRTELMPVKSSSEAIGRYVGKYIGKHIENRSPEDKNARLVRYSTGSRMASTRFMFLSDGSANWRAKVAVFAALVSSREGVPATFEGLRLALGKNWAHRHRDFIASLPVLGS
jgi:hypothetical protein